MSGDSFVTAYAGRGLELAKLFTLFVGSTAVAAGVGAPFTVALTTPHGPSTGNGVQNLQHITFTRDRYTITVGSIDVVDQVIELRSFEHLVELQHRRDKTLPLRAADHAAFVLRVRRFAASLHYALVVNELVQPAEPVRSRAPWLAVAASLGVVAGFVAVQLIG
jgi:hypothetical protein